MDKTLPEAEKDRNVLLQTLEGHSDPVNAVTFSPDGQGAGVGIARQHGQAVGRRVGRGAADARGPFRPCQSRHLLAGWQGAGVGIVGHDGQAVGRRVGRGATHARNQYHYQTSLIFRGRDMSSNRQRTAGASTYSLPVLGWIIYNPFSSPCPG